MSSSNIPELSEILSSEEQTVAPEKLKKGTNSAPYSGKRIGILSIFFSAIVGAFMLADNYEQLNDRKTANRLRIGFFVGVPVLWFLFDLAITAFGGSRGSVSTIVVTTFLSWWIPLFVLDRCYHRWSEEWIETNGEMVNGNGSGRAGGYIALFVLVCRAFIVVVPQMVDSLPLTRTTFTDGTFSMSYPSSWDASENTDNPLCGILGFQCVQKFELPGSRGVLVVNRSSNFLDLMMPLATQGQFNWAQLQLPGKWSLGVFDTTLDGYIASRQDFVFSNPSEPDGPPKGTILVATTGKEVYIIVALSISSDFESIEQALSTIQLDQALNSE